MNSQTVEITSAGIRKILNKYTPDELLPNMYGMDLMQKQPL